MSDRSTTRPDVWDAATYDAPRRRLIPDFDRFYGTAAELVAEAVPPDAEILDLGAGTGLLSEAVRALVPDARFTLLDGSEPMLLVAQQRLGASARTLAVEDLTQRLPPVPFDAVVSALAIHHLSDGDKQDLFERILRALVPGGIFVNAEQVLGPTDRLERQNARAHEEGARELGSDDTEWAGAVERMSHDRTATLDAQLRWLREIGYDDVDVAFKRFRFAVYSGRRPGPR